MKTPNISGFWTGTIDGTNQGGLTLDIKQNGEKITGTAKLNEPSLGLYEYTIDGTIKDRLSFRLQPLRKTAGIQLGAVQAVCEVEKDGSLSGRWKSSIGTEGAFTAHRRESKKLAPPLPDSNSVFLVHGHDDGAKYSVARFLEQIGVTPVILHEQLNQGMTVIEKFEDVASRAGFAVVLMTPDDIGYKSGKEEEKKSRPRQNVILELGYFTAKLGRRKTIVLTKGEIEIPSDVLGLIYEPMDRSEGWKMRLAQELKASGFNIDLNKAIA